MYDFKVGDFALITAGNPVKGFLLQTPIKGLESPKHRTTTYPLPGRDGVSVSSKFLDGRLIELVGKIFIEASESIATYEQRRLAFIAAVMNSRDDNGRPLPIRVSFTTLAGRSYYVDAYFDEPVMPLDSPVDTVFMVTAVGNLIYSKDTQASGNISRPTGGGFLSPFVSPFISAASTGGTVILTNSGTTTTFPSVDTGGIVLTGSLTNPVLTNATTGQFIELNYTLPSGSFIRIDMLNHTILLNDSSSLIGTKTSTSEWWGLAPGVNSIKLSTTGGTDGGYVSVFYNEAFIGI